MNTTIKIAWKHTRGITETYVAKKFPTGWGFRNPETTGLLSLGGVDQCCQPTLKQLLEVTYGRYRTQIVN